MSGMGALAAALQGGMDGFLKGTAYVKGQERDEEDKKFRQEQRALMSEQMARQRKEWAATDAIEGAAATVHTGRSLDQQGHPDAPGGSIVFRLG